MIDLVEEFWSLEDIEQIYESPPSALPDDFREAFHELLGRRGKLVLTGSARHALASLLGTLMGQSPRRRVLISAFNCRVVGKVIEQAGLKIDTFDFSAPNGRIEWESVAQMLTDKHLAVVVPHFFGIPSDFRAILSAAQRQNAVIIEDCAHSLGGSIAGTRAGQLGDAAIFSFNYDKPISLAGGGALLVNNRSIDIKSDAVERVPDRRLELNQFRQLTATLRYRRKRKTHGPLMSRLGARLHPLPALPTGIGALRASVGIWQLHRYAAICAQRNSNAEDLLKSVGHLSWHVDRDVRPAYLKLRVVVNSLDAVRAVQQCADHGITIANSNWPKVISSSENALGSPWANIAATCGVEIPVHQNLQPKHVAQIALAFSVARSADSLGQQ